VLRGERAGNMDLVSSQRATISDLQVYICIYECLHMCAYVCVHTYVSQIQIGQLSESSLRLPNPYSQQCMDCQIHIPSSVLLELPSNSGNRGSQRAPISDLQVCICIYECLHTCAHVCVHAYVCMFTYLYVYMRTCNLSHMYTQNTHTCIEYP